MKPGNAGGAKGCGLSGLAQRPTVGYDKERLMQLTLPVTGGTPAWLSTMAQVMSSPERHQRPDVAHGGKSQ